MTPTPFSASWPSGIRQRTCSQCSLSARRWILTGYRLARVIVQRPRFVKKFCRFAFRLGGNRTVKSFQCPLNPRNMCSPSYVPAVAGLRTAGTHHHPVALHSYNRLEQWKFPHPPCHCSGRLLRRAPFPRPGCPCGASDFHPRQTKNSHPEGAPFSPEGSQLLRHAKFRRIRSLTHLANASRPNLSIIA
jgi:hypothetical protein